MKRLALVLAAAASCALLSTPAYGANPFPAPRPAPNATPVQVNAGTTTADIDIKLPARNRPH